MAGVYVVRVVLFPDEQQRIGTLIGALQFAGAILLHREDGTGSCFDVLPPRSVGDDVVAESAEWARVTAEHWTSLGYNAVKAPAWDPALAEQMARGFPTSHRCTTVDCCGDPEDVATGERLAAERVERSR